MKGTPIIKIAVALAIVAAIGLYLFLPFAPVTSNLTVYAGSEYYPLIESIEDYRLSFLQPYYKNNFEGIIASLRELGNMVGSAPDMNGADGGGSVSESGNGSYVEATDNQVAGVIESDLMKMTDKYIFRLGYRYEGAEFEDDKGIYVQQIPAAVLRVYSIDKKNSALVSEYRMPIFDNEYFKDYADAEMFLSLDGNTVTVIKNYTDEDTNMGKVGITSLDVSDVNNISVKGMVSIDGSLNTSRMVDGKLLLITEFYFNRQNVDYNDPSTFVPTIDSGSGSEPIEFEDIIFPEEIGNTRYSVVALLDADNMSLLGANALLNFTSDVYVSENNVYVTREYTEITEADGEEHYADMTDVAVLDYSGESLNRKGIIRVNGFAEDQYSFDEKEGYLRVVTTTREGVSKIRGESVSFTPKQNVSLYVFNLSDNSLSYSVEDFAIEGEEATAVRFDGDMVYVCTAVVISFTDPVYFIDLSDYESIVSADTGIIEGYSDHLINYGEGFLLGIGEENWQYSKVEIYEQQGGSVVSVDEFKFIGEYSLDYKSYLVNRECDLFGFGVDYFYEYDEQTGYGQSHQRYVLLQFDGYALNVAAFVDIDNMRADTVRAAYIDGYLYVTTPTGLKVEKIN